MKHSSECIACQLLELIQIFTSENIKDCLIRIQEFSWFLCFINEKSTRHMHADLLYYRECALIQLKLFSEHFY